MFTLAKSYSFGDNVCTAGGLPIGGFGEGGVTFEPLTPERVTTEIGPDGLVTGVQSKDRRFRMTIHLMETSTSNTTIKGLQALQEIAKGPLKTLSYNQPLFYRDLNTGEQMVSNQIIWEGDPSMTKQAAPNERVWTAILPNPVYTPANL
jgi:hypothetical protein